VRHRFGTSETTKQVIGWMGEVSLEMLEWADRSRQQRVPIDAREFVQLLLGTCSRCRGCRRYGRHAIRRRESVDYGRHGATGVVGRAAMRGAALRSRVQINHRFRRFLETEILFQIGYLNLINSKYMFYVLTLNTIFKPFEAFFCSIAINLLQFRQLW